MWIRQSPTSPLQKPSAQPKKPIGLHGLRPLWFRGQPEANHPRDKIRYKTLHDLTLTNISQNQGVPPGPIELHLRPTHRRNTDATRTSALRINEANHRLRQSHVSPLNQQTSRHRPRLAHRTEALPDLRAVLQQTTVNARLYARLGLMRKWHWHENRPSRFDRHNLAWARSLR